MKQIFQTNFKQLTRNTGNISSNLGKIEYKYI